MLDALDATVGRINLLTLRQLLDHRVHLPLRERLGTLPFMADEASESVREIAISAVELQLWMDLGDSPRGRIGKVGSVRRCQNRSGLELGWPAIPGLTEWPVPSSLEEAACCY